jgi:Protein of unknown function (DUF3727)/Protein of unknown function (DUF1292)
MSPSPQPEDFDSAELVTLNDEFGRALPCYVEREFELDGEEYLLLLPVDAPIEIFAWSEDDEEIAELEAIDSDDDLNNIFADAHAVLSEQNLTLKRSAFTLSAAGELPGLDPDEVLSIELEEGEQLEPEEYQILARFYNEEQEYAICTPVDPLLFFGKTDAKGNISLLTEEETQRLQPHLEDLLLDEI